MSITKYNILYSNIFFLILLEIKLSKKPFGNDSTNRVLFKNKAEFNFNLFRIRKLSENVITLIKAALQVFCKTRINWTITI